MVEHIYRHNKRAIQYMYNYTSYLSAMELWKRLTNQTSEYWYIGSILGKSVVEKNSTEPCSATGR